MGSRVAAPVNGDDLDGLPAWFARAACHGMTDPEIMFDGPEDAALAVCARVCGAG